MTVAKMFSGGFRASAFSPEDEVNQRETRNLEVYSMIVRGVVASVMDADSHTELEMIRMYIKPFIAAPSWSRIYTSIIHVHRLFQHLIIRCISHIAKCLSKRKYTLIRRTLAAHLYIPHNLLSPIRNRHLLSRLHLLFLQIHENVVTWIP